MIEAARAGLRRLGSLFGRPGPGPAQEHLTADRLLAHHAEGLLRVASVIDGSPDYDALLEDRLDPEDIAVYADGAGSALARTRATDTNVQVLRKGGRVIAMREAGIAFDGQTANNLREFDFLTRLCCSLGPETFGTNYGDAPRIAGPKQGAFDTAAQATILQDVRNFYASRNRITAGLVHQQVTYSKATLLFARSFAAPGAVKPRAIVQANDHSPARVALSMVAKTLGIPRIYVQHAEVSSAFPPLDMDHAVLRNARSLETYRAIGPVHAKTYVIRRESTGPDLASLALDRGVGVDVVIYPTSRLSTASFSDVVARLTANPDIARISVKPHPNMATAMDALLVPESNLIIETEMPKHDHIAVVGNSSVSVELIARGIPVYQCFALDAVQPDYYGLVAAGITQAVELEALPTRFWTPYQIDADWRSVFAELVPADGDEDAAALVAAIAALRG